MKFDLTNRPLITTAEKHFYKQNLECATWFQGFEADIMKQYAPVRQHIDIDIRMGLINPKNHVGKKVMDLLRIIDGIIGSENLEDILGALKK